MKKCRTHPGKRNRKSSIIRDKYATFYDEEIKELKYVELKKMALALEQLLKEKE